MDNKQIASALLFLVPQAQWSLIGNDFEDIEWIEGDKPTLEQLKNQLEILSAKKTEAEAEAQAKRQALLDKLGITEEEARLLLGGN